MLNTEPVLVVDGVPVFDDHEDRDQFWYLPTRVALATRDDGTPIFAFTSYRDPEGNGGGFLNIQVELTLPDQLRRRVETRIAGSGLSNNPRLTQVPFTEGGVQCITLDAGPRDGGAAKPASGDGAPVLVNQVLGSSKPGLMGNNTAIFTLALSKTGAEVVIDALKSGQALLGVVYQLDYLAMQPPLKVKVTAKMDQVYRFLGTSVSAQYKFTRADLSAAIERLHADKVITFERTDAEGSAASGKELDAAMQMFADMLVKDLFTPMLVPGNPLTPLVPNTPYDPNMRYNPSVYPPLNPRNPNGIANRNGLNGNGIRFDTSRGASSTNSLTPRPSPTPTPTPTPGGQDNPFKKPDSGKPKPGNPFART